MAETYLGDLQTVGLKDFNPTWSLPTRIGNRWHSEWLHGIYLLIQRKARKHCRVMCPEQDCESLVYMSDQNTSMIESIGLREHPFWKERVERFYGWFHKSSKPIRQIVPIQRRRHFHGEILEISILALTICIQTIHPWKSVQSRKLTILRRSSSSRTWGGSRRS